ncbi:MAG: SNF2-related protein [Spirochaetota bacterium]
MGLMDPQGQASKGKHRPFQMALSGAPVENNLGELYSLFSFLMPGFFDYRHISCVAT